MHHGPLKNSQFTLRDTEPNITDVFLRKFQIPLLLNINFEVLKHIFTNWE